MTGQKGRDPLRPDALDILRSADTGLVENTFQLGKVARCQWIVPAQLENRDVAGVSFKELTGLARNRSISVPTGRR